METWVLVTLGAAVFQTMRFMLQKHLSGAALSVTGATFARFVYSAPLITLLMLGYLNLRGISMPIPAARFWVYALLGGLGQVVATICVVAVFKMRNFAVGITLMKTEVVLTALVGFVLLGEGVTLPALLAIFIGLAGVLMLTDMPELAGGRLKRMWNRAAGLGLASGAIFAVSSVAYRAASLEVASEDPFARAVVTLAVVTMSQMIGMALWMVWRAPGQMARVFGAWRVAVWVGLTSMAGSLCWFTAFTLQNATYVKAVGQVELILSLLASVLFFRERLSLREFGGIALLSVSIAALILLR